jgi:hypothetical protein
MRDGPLTEQPETLRLPRLNYRRARSRRAPRYALLLCASTALALSFCVAWPKLRVFNAQLQYRRLLGDCRNYCLPADTVAFEPNPDKAQGLLQGANYRPHAMDALDAVRVIQPWNALSRKMGLVGEGAAVFCHARKSPSGKDRLVVIAYILNGVPSGCVVDLSSPTPTICRASWSVSHDLGASYRVLNGPHMREATLFGGQADPKDSSHFSIRYRCADAEGIIDAWLRDDDRVRLRALTGPCKRPLSYFEEMEAESGS